MLHAVRVPHRLCELFHELAGRLPSVCHCFVNYQTCPAVPFANQTWQWEIHGNPPINGGFHGEVIGGFSIAVRKVLREFAYFTRISETWRMVKLWGLVTSWVLRQLNGKWMWMLGDLMWSGEVWFTFFQEPWYGLLLPYFRLTIGTVILGKHQASVARLFVQHFFNMGCMRLASHNDNIETLNENPGWSQACRISCFGFYRPPMAALDSQFCVIACQRPAKVVLAAYIVHNVWNSNLQYLLYDVMCQLF